MQKKGKSPCPSVESDAEKEKQSVLVRWVRRKKYSIMTGEEDFQSILEKGISFGRGGERRDPNEGKVKTKAKKKKYITGAHGSGSARQKAKYREQRNNRKH